MPSYRTGPRVHKAQGRLFQPATAKRAKRARVQRHFANPNSCGAWVVVTDPNHGVGTAPLRLLMHIPTVATAHGRGWPSLYEQGRTDIHAFSRNIGAKTEITLNSDGSIQAEWKEGAITRRLTVGVRKAVAGIAYTPREECIPA